MSDVKRTIIPIMLLGDTSVGKTSLILRLTGNKFDDNLLSTIGKESFEYLTRIQDNDIKMKIWDTSGQERFKSISLNVIKTVEGLILTYSIIKRESFNNLESWITQLKDIIDISKKAIIIVGNKKDMPNRQVTYEEGKNYADKYGFHFFETSAKTGEGIKEAFGNIFNQLYTIFEDEIIGTKEYIKPKRLKKKSKKKEKKKCC